LAFSVAAHLDADILLIDEVLAVGDLDFQQKSINYLENEGKNKKTVLFVSHKLQHIEQLTERTILLSNGCIELDSHTNETVEYYKNKFINIKEGDQFIPQREYNNQFKIIRLNLYNSENEKKNSFIKGENFKICCKINISNTKINKFSILLTISDGNNNEISGTKTEMKDINNGTYIFEFIEDEIRYNWGDYFISLHFFSGYNCLAEYNSISRISFVNKMIQGDIHYGGYLLNPMKTKITIVEE
jgi:lipopolysaccharide transport system ATP-binding protein